MARTALIHRLQRLIERTYDLDTGIEDIAPFIIGDEGFARLYASRSLVRVVGVAAPEAASTLMREVDGALRVCLYYPDRLVENLESHDPRRRLAEENIDDFATFVEELDHFLTIADRHRTGAAVSLLELELHANVTKALMLDLFVARMRGRRRLDAAERAWVRHHLFHKGDYREEDPVLRSRYRDAASLALRYLDHLCTLPAGVRPAELRRFHRRTHHEKLSQIARL